MSLVRGSALLLAVSPLLVCGLVILLLRRSAVVGACAGILVAAAFSFVFGEFAIGLNGLTRMLGTTGILALSAFLVIVPGLYLNAILREQGIINALVSWIQSIRLDAESKAILLLLGILPAVESLTGFGVSLFLAIPIFFRLFAPERAYRLSLLGMNIMPWGTLALATTVGASLSTYPTVALGTATALTSSLVFPTVGLLALAVLGGRPMLRQRALAVTFLGLCLSISLYCFNRFGFVEMAGIFSGMIVSVLGFLLFRVAGRPAAAPGANTGKADLPLRIFFPYGLLLSLLFAMRIVPGLHAWLAGLLTLSSGRVKLSLFTSPGLALTVTALIIFLLAPTKLDHAAVWQRSRTALLSLCCFIFLAQLMNEAQMIAAMAGALRGLESQGALPAALSALLGMISGFITGSNLGGNALAMGMQQQIGQDMGEGLLFSALQNSASGAAVFMSLPIIILVMAIARDTLDALDDKRGAPQVAEVDLLRFGLRCGCLVYLALLVSFVLARAVSTLG